MTFIQKHAKIYIFVGHLIQCKNRSGVQRVVIEIIKSLVNNKLDFELVKWSKQDGQLRLCNFDDYKKIFIDDIDYINRSYIDPIAEKINYGFYEVFDHKYNNWILFPEIPFHMLDGNIIFRKIITQAISYKVNTAAIFYDLIPVLDDEYSDIRNDHEIYLHEILRCDLIIPISNHSSDSLINFYKEIIQDESIINKIEAKIKPISLGEDHIKQNISNPFSSTITRGSDELNIVLLGTIEPRKQQLLVLNIIVDLVRSSKLPQTLTVHVIGSLHGKCANEFENLIKENHFIKYHSYLNEHELCNIVSSCNFSIFASRLEGYGLPIIESLVLGVPCLTSNFGSMAEISARGGCYQVNSLDYNNLKSAIVRIATDEKFYNQLKLEATNFMPKLWNTYAFELVNLLSKTPKDVSCDVYTLPDTQGLVEVKTHENKIIWYCANSRIVNPISYLTGLPYPNRSQGHNLIGADIASFDSSRADSHQLDALMDADVVACKSYSDIHLLLKHAQDQNINKLFTSQVFESHEENDRIRFITRELNNKLHNNNRCRQVAENENIFNSSKNIINSNIDQHKKSLQIVISTYNREKFVDLNVRWILNIIQQYNGRVQLLVVDNDSSDNTELVLQKYLTARYYTYIRNSINVGMLGNLRECSIHGSGDYLWVIGDDDFISESAVDHILRIIDSNPYIPLVAVNFGVYYRSDLSDQENPQNFSREMQILSLNPSPSGVYPVNKVAQEHDNLFTAVYPIIFRNDMIAACFNHPFDGVPFSNLVECIPTSYFLLSHYRYANCYWVPEPLIVGNINNSWSSYRPQWHFNIMPSLFQLSRDAGIDTKVLQEWAKIHEKLFFESIEIALSHKSPFNIQFEQSKMLAEITFQSSLERVQDFINTHMEK